MILENLRSALEALAGNRLRSVLTLLGVMIGVFAVTTTISLGAIATAGITGQLQAFGNQALFITPNEDNPASTPFNDADVDALSRLPVSVLRQRSVRGVARAGTEEAPLVVNGVTANAPQVDRTIKMARGRYFTEAEDRRAAPVMVLSADAREALFPDDPNPVGREVSVTVGGSRTFYTVIGAKEPLTGAFSFAANASADVPLQTFYLAYPAVTRGEYPFLPITVSLERNLGDIEAQVNAILARRRGPDTFRIQTIEGALTLFKTITTILQAVLGGIGAISLLVGGIGILNIMLVSVTERTREIGLRKALGAKKGVILQQFLIEAVALTLVGGLVGLAAAIGTLYLAVALVPFLDEVVLSPFTVLLGLFVSVATGVVFGVWPASRAANLSPIEALRYE
ncbi:MAG TPA: ABC transporter permease [Trueperaceae bacterium]|nr:ABC transporter permease [Trueperaceae bacterium]